MNKVSWLVKASAVATLTAMIAVTSFAGGGSIDAAAQTPAATKAVEIKLDTLCVAPPTPTPAPTTPAPEATMAATMAAAPATMAATMAATKAPPTAVPPTPTKAPTATPIPKGKVPAWMGITLNLNKGFTRGGKACVRVLGVADGGPAAAAGIKAQDLILGVDTVVVKDLPDLYDVVATKKSGDAVEVTYQRAGKAVKVKVTLGLNPTVVELTPAK